MSQKGEDERKAVHHEKKNQGARSSEKFDTNNKIDAKYWYKNTTPYSAIQPRINRGDDGNMYIFFMTPERYTHVKHWTKHNLLKRILTQFFILMANIFAY